MGGAPRCRGIRGATAVAENTRAAILAATAELLALIVARNDLDVEDIASVVFTVTPDLDAEYPARAARELGWDDVALLCAQEIPVPGSLPRCIRVLLHANTTKAQRQMRHVYLGAAASLRPGWADSADGAHAADAASATVAGPSAHAGARESTGDRSPGSNGSTSGSTSATFAETGGNQ
jgi:chorismate mutase